MMTMFFLLSLLSLLLIFKTHLVLELMLFEYLTVRYNLMFSLDSKSLAFAWTIVAIFFMVWLYSFEYLKLEVFLVRFLTILSMFAFFMIILVFSSNLFTSFIGWDGLGVSSLFLIVFYYSRSSYKAGMMTFLMNRVGDCFMILMLTTTFLSMKHLSMFSEYEHSSLLSILILTTSLTKSAQIPFSVWLPAAMEAPTPVSALVHSSTLVTAGIYLLLRYPFLWSMSVAKPVLMGISLSTCLMASLAALTEMDLKKLIALSTLSQLGFITFSLSMLQFNQSFMHMVMHAYFKALMFLCAGYMIHSFKGSQDLLKLSLFKAQNPVLTNIMAVSTLSMMGLPFMAGFYSKDFILDSLKSGVWAVMQSTAVILSLILTVLYSIRMIWYLQNSSSGWNEMSDSHYSMVKPMFPLTIMAVVAGSVFMWSNPSFCSSNVNSSKVLLLLVLTLSGGLTYLFLVKVKVWKLLESKWHLSSLFYMSSTKFFKNSMTYMESTDIMGLPGLYTKQSWNSLENLGNLIANVNFFYISNLPLFFLLLTMPLLIILFKW